MKTLEDYLDRYDENGSTYRFPSIAVGMQYVDEMTDDDWFIIEDRKDADLLRRIQRVFN